MSIKRKFAQNSFGAYHHVSSPPPSLFRADGRQMRANATIKPHIWNRSASSIWCVQSCGHCRIGTMYRSFRCTWYWKHLQRPGGSRFGPLTARHLTAWTRWIDIPFFHTTYCVFERIIICVGTYRISYANRAEFTRVSPFRRHKAILNAILS